MPPAEYGFELLNGLRIKILRLWILNCAIEDYSKMGEEDLLQNEDDLEKVRSCEDF